MIEAKRGCVLRGACAGALTDRRLRHTLGVERLDPQAVHLELTRNVLSTGALSQFTENVLRQYALDTVAAEDAATVLAELHAAVSVAPPPEVLFALTELSFQHAESSGGRPDFLAAAIYAFFAFLFPDDAGDLPSAFDPRFRWAADVYNRALTEAARGLRAGRGARHPRPVQPLSPGGPLGAPLAASTVPLQPRKAFQGGPRVKVPV